MTPDLDPPPAGQPPLVEVPVRRPPFWTRGVRHAALGLAVLAWLWWPESQAALQQLLSGPLPQQAARALLTLLAAPAMAVALVALVRLRTRPRRLPAVEVHVRGLLLPRGPDSAERWWVPYRQLDALRAFSRGPDSGFLISGGGNTEVFPPGAFHRADAAHAILHAARRAISAQPEATEILAHLSSRENRARAIALRKPLVTHALLGLLAAIFFLEVADDALSSPHSLVPYGANLSRLVAQGQYYRLLSANFLHGSFLHLYMNGLGLLALGSMIERLLGPARFLVIYTVSGVVGSIASAAMGRPFASVGASGAIFGLLGALAWLNLRFRDALPAGYVQPRRTWIIVGAINTALPVLFPQIDWVAHLAGLLAGGVATRLTAGDRRALRDPRAGLGLRLAAAVAAALSLWAVQHGVLAGPGRAEQDLRQMLTQATSRSPLDAAELNELAWTVVETEDASRAALSQARRAARLAVRDSPASAAYLDTLACVEMRLGHHRKALELARRAVDQEDDPYFVSQVARIAARARDEAEVEQLAAALHLELKPAGGSSYELTVDADLPQGLDVWLLQRHVKVPAAAIVGIEPGRGPHSVRFRLPRELMGPDPVVALIDTSTCPAPCRLRHSGVLVVPPHPLVQSLP